MADDYLHLLAVHRLAEPLTGHFAAWFSRVPVWAVASWALFTSQWLEQSWSAVHLAFACHATGLVLMVAALLRALPVPTELGVLRPLLASMVACLYSNTYEILFWPTCMAYTLGSLALGLGAYARRRGTQALAFTVAGLTYETFILPALAWALLPALAATGSRRWALARRGAATWGAALVAVLAARAAGAWGQAPFVHLTDFAPGHVAVHLSAALAQLVRLRHYRMHTALGPSLALVATLALGVQGLRGVRRQQALALLAAAAGSTALAWVLAYEAIRSVYGAQLLLCATLAWLLCHGLAASGWRLMATMVLAVVLAAGYAAHHAELIEIKVRNAARLVALEADWATRMRACTGPCTLRYDNLGAGLEPDWVLPPSDAPRFLAWVQHKHAVKQVLNFVPQSYDAQAPSTSP